MTETATTTSPYMGLGTFSEADSKLFHGREKETDELFHLVQRETLAVVFGMSGLGKSSLLRAGLFPRLREANLFPIVIRLTYRTSDLLSQIRAAIGDEIARHQVDAPAPTSEHTLWEYFHRTPLWDQRNRVLVPVLVFDQFEELFTLGRTDEHRGAFLTELGDLVENRIPDSFRSGADADALPPTYAQPKAKVVLSLREDYLARLEDLRAGMPSLSRGRFRLRAMDGAQAVRAIHHEQTEQLVDANVAATVARFVAGASGTADLESLTIEPALLSLVCRQLDELRMRRGEKTITADLLSGESARILDDFYEQSMSGLDASVGEYLEENLLTPDGHRTTVALSSVERRPGMAQAIETLVDRRILRIEERLGRPHVEVIHDVLTPVIGKRRERRRGESARRRKLARRIVLAASAAVLAFAIVGTVLYISARRHLDSQAEAQRRDVEKERRRNALEASGTLTDQASELYRNRDFWGAARLIGVAYGIVGLDEVPSDLAVLTHRVTSYDSLLAAAFPLTSPDLIALAFSGDGSRLFLANADGTVTWWETKTWTAHKMNAPEEPAATGSGSGSGSGSAKSERPRLVQFVASGEGTRAVLVTAIKGGYTLDLWDIAAGKSLATATFTTPDADARITLDASGTWIAAGSSSKSGLWHYEDKTLAQRMPTVTGCPTERPPSSRDPDPYASDFDLEGADTGASLSFSGDGHVLAIREAHRVTLWRLDDAPKQIGKPLCRETSTVALSQDGSIVALLADDATRMRQCMGNAADYARCRAIGWTGGGGDLYWPKTDVSEHVTADWVLFDAIDPSAVALFNSKAIELRTGTGKTTIARSCLTDKVVLRDHQLTYTDRCGKVRLWSSDRDLDLELPVRDDSIVALAPSLLATADSDGVLRVWNLQPGADRVLANGARTAAPSAQIFPFILGAPSSVGDLAVTKDGKTVVAGALDMPMLSKVFYSQGTETLAMFDVASHDIKKINQTRMEHAVGANNDRGVGHVELSPDETKILTTGHDRHVRVWRRDDGARLFEFGDDKTRPIRYAMWSTNGQTIVTADLTHEVCTWDGTSGSQRACAKIAEDPEAAAIAERGVALGQTSGDVVFWDLVAGHAPIHVGRQSLAQEDVAIDPSGRWIAGGSEDGSAVVWDTQSCTDQCKEVARIESGATVDYVRFVQRGARTLLIAMTHNNRAYLLWLDDPKQPRVLDLAGFATSIEIRDDRLLTCDFGVIEEWNLETGAKTGRIDLIPDDSRNHDSNWCEAHYISERRLAVRFSDGSLSVWPADALATGLASGRVRFLRASDDNRFVTTWDGRDARTISTENGATVAATASRIAPAIASAFKAVTATRWSELTLLDHGTSLAGAQREPVELAADGDNVLAIDAGLQYRLTTTGALDGAPERTIDSSRPHGRFVVLEAAPSGKWFAAATGDGSVYCYDGDGKMLGLHHITGRPHAITPAVNGDGLLVIGSHEVLAISDSGAASHLLTVTPQLVETAAAWDVERGLLIATSSQIELRDLNGASKWHRSAREDFKYKLPAFAAIDGASARVVVASELQIGLFNLADGSPLQWFHRDASDTAEITGAWVVDRKTLMTRDASAHIFVWDIATGKREKILPAIDLARAPNGRWLVHEMYSISIAHAQGRDFVTDAPLKCKTYDPQVLAWGASGELAGAGYDADGAGLCVWDGNGVLRASWSTAQSSSKLAFVGGHLVSLDLDGALRIWAPDTQKLLHKISEESLIDALFARGSAWIVTGDDDGKLRIYDAKTGKVAAETGDVRSSSQAKLVARVYDKTSTTLVVVDGSGGFAAIEIPSGRVLRKVAGDNHAPSSEAVSRGGAVVAIAYDKVVRLFRKDRPAVTIAAPGVVDLEFSPDGSLLATADGISLDDSSSSGQKAGIAQVWNVETARSVLTVTTSRDLAVTTWSEDGTKIYLGGASGYLEIVDVAREQRAPDVVRKIIDRLAPHTTGQAPRIVREPQSPYGARGMRSR